MPNPVDTVRDRVAWGHEAARWYHSPFPRRCDAGPGPFHRGLGPDIQRRHALSRCQKGGQSLAAFRWKKLPAVGAAHQLQAAVAPLFASLFHPKKTWTYQWNIHVDSHGGEDVQRSAAVRCKSGNVQLASIGTTKIAHVCIVCKEVGGSRRDYSPAMELCFVASQSGLWDGPEKPPSETAARTLLAGKPMFPAVPKPASWDYKERDPESTDASMTSVQADITSKPHNVWCRSDSWDAMYSPSTTLCLKAGTGIVSYDSSGGEAPSDASYRLVCGGLGADDRAAVHRYSPQLGFVTVTRTRETCGLSGSQVKRATYSFTEVYNAKGKVVRRFQGGKHSLRDLQRAVRGKPRFESAAKYDALLSTGGFVAPTASLNGPNGVCVASMHVLGVPTAGVKDTPYLVRMKVKHGNKTVLWSRLMAGAEPGGSQTKWAAKTYFLPKMAMLVVEGSAPTGATTSRGQKRAKGKAVSKALLRVFPSRRFKKLRKCFSKATK